MKKHWRKLVLLAVVLASVCVAGAAWLGFLPVARPTTEVDFMAEQLRRVRYAGQLRSEHEVGLNELLPDDPGIDDLRVAYFRYRMAQYAKQAREFIDAHPEYAEPDLPATDRAAHDEYEQLAALCRKLEIEYRLQYDEPRVDGEMAEFMNASDDVIDRLDACRPASGKMLLGTSDSSPFEIELMENSTAPFRVGVARVLFLLQLERTDEALTELRSLAKFAHGLVWCPGILNELMYTVATGVVYEKGILVVAERELASAEWLLDLSDTALLPKPNLIDLAEVEHRLSLAGQAHPSTQTWPADLERDVARSGANDAFEEYGATSLDDWVRQEFPPDNKWDLWFKGIEQLREHPVDFRNAAEAEPFFAKASASPIGTHWDQATVIANIATSTLEPEAFLVATRIYYLKMTSPDGWKTELAALAKEHPFLLIQADKDSVHIRTNPNHPTVKRGRTSDRILATVR